VVLVIAVAVVYVAPWAAWSYMRFKAAQIRAQLESYHTLTTAASGFLADIP